MVLPGLVNLLFGAKCLRYLKPLPWQKIKTACAAGRVTYSRRLAMSMSKKCGACEKTIYPNDPKLSMGDHTYHKSCSKCEVCGGQLNIKNFATSGGRLVRSFWSLVSCLLSRCVGGVRVAVVQFGGWSFVSFPILCGRWVVVTYFVFLFLPLLSKILLRSCARPILW